jgi:hypothetical protein
MANNPRLAVLSRNAALDSALDAIGSGGKLRFYDGTQPTDADTALGAQNVLAECSTPFAAASAGSKAANAISNGTISASGTATWASFLTSGNVRKFDVSVGTSSADIVVNSVAFSSGATLSVSSFTATMAAG